VVAALLCEDGRVFIGVNVENASYGLSLCAERNAMAAAITAGARHFRAIYVTCSGPRPPAPCGACRQVLAEFPPGFVVRSQGTSSEVLELSTGELLPHPFGPSNLD
jgi:cytidine deaminase